MRDEEEQDCLFVNVPAEEEGGVGGQGEGGEKSGEVGSQEEFREGGLAEVVSGWVTEAERRACTSCVRMVRMNVKRGVISGRTAKEVSPTRPRVTLVRASRLTGRCK